MISTKTFSNRQESMISEYLGWDKVAASGARNFHPGDIICDDWIGECKTRMDVKDDIIFYANQWLKICEESQGVFRYPALFVDNGSQSIEYTWVMYKSKNFLSQKKLCLTLDTSENLRKILHKKVHLKFNVRDLNRYYQDMIHKIEVSGLDELLPVIEIEFANEVVGLLPLHKFAEVFGKKDV